MNHYQVQVSSIIHAPAQDIYAVIADYHQGHPSILPPRYFTSLEVIKGGQGAGTEISVAMDVFGTKARYHMTVSEPEPGRVLLEEDVDAGVITTFTVDPIDDGTNSRVTILTDAQTGPGLRGWIEKLVTPAVSRRIYREELAQLDRVMQAKR